MIWLQTKPAMNFLERKFITSTSSQKLPTKPHDTVEYDDLRKAAGMPDTPQLEQLLTFIPNNEERIFKALWLSDALKGKHTAFLTAAMNSSDHAEVILEHVDISSDQGFSLIRYTPEKATVWSILSHPSYFFQRECYTKDQGRAIKIMCCLVRRRITYSQWVQLMRQRDGTLRTLLGWSMASGLTELSIFILNTLKPGDRGPLLTMEGLLEITPMDSLFRQLTFMSEEPFTSLLDLMIVNDKEGFYVMKSCFNKLCKSDYKDQNGRYIMSTKRRREYVCDAIKVILERFSPEYQLDLIEPAGGLESEVKRESEAKNVDLHPIIQLLRTRRTRAKMAVILKTPGRVSY